MSIEKYVQKDGDRDSSKKLFAIYLTDGMLYDNLHRFAAEYSLPVELLVNLAVKRLADDIEFIRNLRPENRFFCNKNKL